MKKLLIGIVGLVLLLVGAAFLLPGFIDWNSYRGDVAAVLERATGRRVEIAGDIQLALLPTPTLSAARVSLFERDSTRPALAEIGRADLRVRLQPLLTGSVQVERLVLDAAHVRVLRLSDGSWVLPVDPEAQDLGGVRVERLDLHDGTLEVEDRAAGRDLLLEGLEASLDGGASDGSVALDSRFRAGGQDLALNANLGALPNGRSLRPLRAGLTADGPDGTTATLRFAGVASTAAPVRFEGQLEAAGGSAAPLVLAARTALGLDGEWAAPAALAQPLAWRSGIKADRRLLSLDGIELTLGGSRATGSADIPLRAGVDGGALVLSFAHLDLDAAGGLGQGLPQPPAPLALDLLADTAGWRGGQLRDLRLVGGLVAERLTVESLTATLPGGTGLTAAGTLALDRDGTPTIDSTVELRTNDLRQTLGWLGLDVSTVPAERLRDAALTARLTGTPRSFQLLDASGSLDTTTLSGSLAVDRGQRLSVRAGLLADRLVLDAYRRAEAGPLPWRAWWTQLDLTLDARVGQLTLGGVQMDGLVLAGTLADGVLTLRDGAVDNAAGVKGRLTGRVGGLDPLGPTDLALEAEAQTVATLARALQISLPVAPERLGPVKLTARAAGDQARLDVSLDAGLLGGTLQIGGTVGNPQGDAALDLKARATLPETVDLVRLWMPGWTPGAPRVGATDLYAVLSGTPQSLSIADIQGRAADTSVTGHLSLDRGGPVPRLTGALTAGPLDLDLLLPALTRSGGPWTLGWVRRMGADLALESEKLTIAGQAVESARLHLAAGDGALRIEGLEGRWRDGTLTGRFHLSQPEAPAEGATLAPLAGEGGLSVGNAALPVLDGGGLLPANGRFDLALEARGQGEDPVALVRALVGSGTVAWREGVVSGIDLPALSYQLPGLTGSDGLSALLARTLRQGATPIAQGAASFNLADGVFTSQDLVLESPTGRIEASGRLAGRELTAKARVQLAEPDGVPAFSLSRSGPLAAANVEVAAAELEGWVKRQAAARRPPAPAPAEEPAATPVAAPVPQAPAKRPSQSPPPTERPAGPEKSVQDILQRLKEQGSPSAPR